MREGPECAAAKRWLQKNFGLYRRHGPITLLGDDRYAHQPFCRQALLHDDHFLFTAKPTSHLRALTLDLHFPNWQGLLRFRMRGLELGPCAKKT